MNNLYNPKYHLKIPEIPKGVQRPLWSVVIPTYNCALFLKETLKSVLIQDQGPDQMEIIVVDDHSTKDDTEAVVKQYGQGRVRFIRQKENVGKVKNYETGLKVSQGILIHLLHGDDTIENGFYFKIQELYYLQPKCGAFFSRCNYVNADNTIRGQSAMIKAQKGLVKNFKFLIAIHQQIQPPSIVFKREVYETIGSYDKRLTHIEDWEFYVRASLCYDYSYTPEVLANYRVYDENSSSRSVKRGRRLKKIKQVYKVIDEYLPKDLKTKIIKERKRAEAEYLMLYIPKFINDKDFIGYFKTLFRIFQTSLSLRMMLRASKISYRGLKN